jgi:hypothetical protein
MAGQMNGRLGHGDRAGSVEAGQRGRAVSMTGPFATKPGRHGGGGQILDAVAAATLQVSNACPDAAKLCTKKYKKNLDREKLRILKAQVLQIQLLLSSSDPSLLSI